MRPTRTNEIAIKDLEELYPKLDFSKFEYKRNNINSTVICPIHGEFQASYSNLVKSKAKVGCRKCAEDACRMTQEEAISNLQAKFPDYDFSKFVYVKSQTKSIVICPKHGEVEISYNNAMNRRACPLCGREKGRVSKKENFLKSRDIIKELSEMYPNLDFSKFNYIKSHIKSTVICPEHGEFQAKFNDLSSLHKNNKDAKGCPECFKKKIYEHIELVKEKYKEYDFSKFEYVGHKEDVTLICKKHGEFTVNYGILYKLNRKSEPCPLCRDPIYKLKEKFPELDFSKFKYTGYKNKSIVICPIHGEFENSYDNLFFKSKYGCPYCCKGKQFSSYEKEILEFVKSCYSGTIEENNRNIIINKAGNTYMEIDIYLPDISVGIEFNGKYFHTDEKIRENRRGFNSAQEYHDYKTLKCKEKGITLIHIDENDYINNKELVFEEIKSKIIPQINKI